MNEGSTLQPTWALTGVVKKSALIDPSRGAALYDICLGTANISTGTPTEGCDPNPPTAPPFSTSASSPKKGGGCAVPDGAGKFWGNVPNAPGNIKKCSQATTPVVLSKNKTGSGDLVVVFCAPYPWDGAGAHH